MKSKYLYGIIIVVILLVLLLVYNMMKGAPLQNANNNNDNNNKNKNIPNTISINVQNTCTSISLTLNVTGATSFIGMIDGIYSGSVISKAAQSIIGPASLNFISYSNGCLNFVMDTSIVNNTPVSEYSIQISPLCGIGINDTDTTHSFYSATNVTVSGNTLVFTNNSNKLTLTFFTNKCTTNTMSLNVIRTPSVSFVLDVIGNKSFTGTVSNITSGLNLTGAAITATGFNQINFISFGSNSYLNFVMDTSIVNNTPVSVYSLYVNPAYGISVSDSDTTHSLYDTSSVTVFGNTLTFTNNSNKLIITFCGNIPIPNTLSINVSQDKTSLTLSVVNNTIITTTVNNLTGFTVSTAAQSITGIVPVHFVMVNNGIINFIMDSSIVNNTPVSYYSLNLSANKITFDNTYNGVFYNTYGVTAAAENQIAFFSGVNTLALMFPNNFV